MHAASLFFAVRGTVRTKLAQGKKLDPSAWLRVETVKFIADHDGPSMRSIADYLSITAPSATSLISSLEKDGLVARTTDVRDRRSSRLTLTRKGKSVLGKTLARGTRILGEVFAPLSSTELAAFARALARIKDGAGE